MSSLLEAAYQGHRFFLRDLLSVQFTGQPLGMGFEVGKLCQGDTAQPVDKVVIT